MYVLHYFTAFDFILLVLITHQLTVFKKESSQMSHENNFQKNDNTTYEYFTDHLSQTKFVWKFF